MLSAANAGIRKCLDYSINYKGPESQLQFFAVMVIFLSTIAEVMGKQEELDAEGKNCRHGCSKGHYRPIFYSKAVQILLFGSLAPLPFKISPINTILTRVVLGGFLLKQAYDVEYAYAHKKPVNAISKTVALVLSGTIKTISTIAIGIMMLDLPKNEKSTLYIHGGKVAQFGLPLFFSGAMGALSIKALSYDWKQYIDSMKQRGG
jgi:hypothetical protein